jgi:hypothetical protein
VDDDRTARLTAVRDRLEAAIADATTRDLPSLSREYRLILAELEALHTPQERDVVDQLAARRAATESSAERRAQ